MGLIPLDQLSAGMTLAADVKDRSGRIILSGGNIITEKHLKIFRMWGITQADVRQSESVQDSPEQPTETDPELLQEAEYRMGELFHHVDREHPAMRELARLATKRLVKKTEEGGNGNNPA
jgi:hypothetical protein